MKRFGLFFIGSLLGVFCLTSCLEGSNVSSSEAIGVLDISSKSLTAVLKTAIGEFYAPEINSIMNKGDLQLGDHLYVYYSIDFDLTENSENMVETNGYYTVSVNNYLKFDNNYLNYYFTDTTEIPDNEVAVNDPFYTDYGGLYTFYDKYMYITHVVNQPEDLILDWNLSYDAATMMPTEIDGRRYYDLFVRATKSNESSKTTTADCPYYIVYDMGSYLSDVASKEKEALGGSYTSTSTFTLRINYISEIKEDNVTWESKEWTPYIASFLPESN